MAPILTATEIARPPEQVFAYVTDPAHFADWQQGVVGGHVEGDGPPRPGSRCVNIRRIGGAERRVTSEITHIDPPTRWAVRGLDGPIRATVDVTVTPQQEGRHSRVVIELDFTGHGIGRVLVALVVRPRARTEMSENLKRLKQQLEGISTVHHPAPSG